MINTKLIYLIVAAIVILIAIVAGYFLYINIATFFVSSTSPDNNSEVAGSTTNIRLNFNKEVDNKSVKNSIISQSDIILSYEKTSEKTITIYLKNISNDKKYTIFLKNIASTDGKILELYTYTFQTKYIPYNQLSKEQQEQELQKTDKGNINDPIMNVTPYTDINFKINNSKDPGSNKFKIIITLLFNAADYRSNNLPQIREQYKKEALNYLVAQGINLNNYTIEYIDQAPSLF